MKGIVSSSGTIFTVDADNRLVEMQPTPFDLEADFQKLLADHPPLLRLAAGSAGALLLISQEYGIADSSDGTDRWSIDHLYVTREGVPILVEVKRASDTRGRREVIAQMLDYASHGTAFWFAADIAARFRLTAESKGLDSDDYLRTFIDGGDTEAFWRQVEANLRSGRIRLVFVSDQIGKELQRIIEWLNEQLRTTEVLAIEIAQFTGSNGARTLVPRLVGATGRAESAKALAPPVALISDIEWIDAFGTDLSPEAGARAKDVIEVLTALGLRMSRTPGQKSARFSAHDAAGKTVSPIYLYEKKGIIEIAMPTFASSAALSDPAWRRSILDRLQKAVPGFKAQPKGIDSYPRVTLQQLLPPAVWADFNAILVDIGRRLNTRTPPLSPPL